jgi:hypothetical protein
MITKPENIDLLYQKIGEFVVSFQWLEHRFRQMGWLIADPKRQIWPPKILRSEKNCLLLSKVEKMYNETMDKQHGERSDVFKAQFSHLIQKSHDFRKYRNDLLHSAFIELKGGGEVLNIMRSNSKLKRKNDGSIGSDSEILTVGLIEDKMREMAELAFSLNIHYMQLIHTDLL